ncbi:hypothetical protein Drorol1_Dr00021648 [Drosera rotundifolia]
MAKMATKRQEMATMVVSGASPERMDLERLVYVEHLVMWFGGQCGAKFDFVAETSEDEEVEGSSLLRFRVSGLFEE